MGIESRNTRFRCVSGAGGTMDDRGEARNVRGHGHGAPRHRARHHDYLPAAGHDALLPAYDLVTWLMGVTRRHRELIELADIQTGHWVLEIGCGTGNLAVLAKRLRPEAEIVGLDPDPRALARAARKSSGMTGIRFDRGYSQRLPYPDGTYDRVLSALMWHHLDGEARARTAEEVLRVLRAGGSLYLLDLGGQVSRLDGFGSRWQLRSDHLRDNLGDAIPRLLLDAGFADCVQMTHRVSRALGRMTYYRANRAA